MHPKNGGLGKKCILEHENIGKAQNECHQNRALHQYHTLTLKFSQR